MLNSKLGKLNFLKFNNFYWFLLNPSNHYQNRLRHNEYIDLVNDNKFQIIEVNNTELDDINFKISNKFKDYLIKDLQCMENVWRLICYST